MHPRPWMDCPPQLRTHNETLSEMLEAAEARIISAHALVYNMYNTILLMGVYRTPMAYHTHPSFSSLGMGASALYHFRENPGTHIRT